MREFTPDFSNIVMAARNIEPKRMPLYEHVISEKVMEDIMNKKFLELYNGSRDEKREFFRNYNNFYKLMGYDTVTMERCIGPAMPGSGALGQHKPGVIKNREDFEKVMDGKRPASALNQVNTLIHFNPMEQIFLETCTP